MHNILQKNLKLYFLVFFFTVFYTFLANGTAYLQCKEAAHLQLQFKPSYNKSDSSIMIADPISNSNVKQTIINQMEKEIEIELINTIENTFLDEKSYEALFKQRIININRLIKAITDIIQSPSATVNQLNIIDLLKDNRYLSAGKFLLQLKRELSYLLFDSKGNFVGITTTDQRERLAELVSEYAKKIYGNQQEYIEFLKKYSEKKVPGFEKILNRETGMNSFWDKFCKLNRSIYRKIITDKHSKFNPAIISNQATIELYQFIDLCEAQNFIEAEKILNNSPHHQNLSTLKNILEYYKSTDPKVIGLQGAVDNLSYFIKHQIPELNLYLEKNEFNISVSNQRSEERQNALNIIKSGKELFTLEYYSINTHLKEFIEGNGYDINEFKEFFGNQYQHCLHKEQLEILDLYAKLYNNQIPNHLINLNKMIIDLALAGKTYNQTGEVALATKCLDFCWGSLSLIGSAIGGVYDGTLEIGYQIAHPIETCISIKDGICILGKLLGNIISHVIECEVASSINPELEAPKQRAFCDKINFIKKTLWKQLSQKSKNEIVRKSTSIATQVLLPGRLASASIKTLKACHSFFNKCNAKALKLIEQTAVTAEEATMPLLTAEGIEVAIAEKAADTFLKSSSDLSSNVKSIASGVIRKANGIPCKELLLTEIKTILKNSPEIQTTKSIFKDLFKKTPKKKFGSIYESDISVNEFQRMLDKTKVLYEEIRSTSQDIAQIAKNTGLPKKVIQKIKDHLFHEEHILHDSIGKFSENWDAYQAWKRLIDGDFVQSDLIMLQHELAESILMNGVKVPYDAVHYQIENLYNWRNSILKG